VKLIVGLGNPGPAYTGTRHNIGADLVAAVARKHHISLNRNSLKSLWGRANLEGHALLLALPLTYMNLSGQAVAALIQYFKINLDDLLVVVDDFSLPLGKLRFRGQGSAGGHNGLKSVIASLGTDVFQRLKIGIGPLPAGREVTGFVLGKFPAEEVPLLAPALDQAQEAMLSWLKEGMEKSMRRFH
jgi:PTH1 family peptidyl-tRNA hydrolase